MYETSLPELCAIALAFTAIGLMLGHAISDATRQLAERLMRRGK